MGGIKLTARLAVITALALIAFMIESLLPPLFAFAPGTKLGLSGVFITMVTALYGLRYSALVLLIKCLVPAMFTGNLFMLYYSLPAGTAAMLCGFLLIKLSLKHIGIVSVSMLSAVVHNIIQVAMAALLFKNAAFLYYAPLAAFAGAAAGIVTGLCLYFIIRAIPENTFYS